MKPRSILSGVMVARVLRKRMLAFIAMIAGCLFLIAPAFADSLSFDFTILNGGASASGGSGTFTLNGNGTIAASLTSLDGYITGFGFDSVALDLPESNFSTAPSNPIGWSDTYGTQGSGFACFTSSCDFITSMTWTIGNPGDFSSVYGALGGGTSTYDFFMYIGANANGWAADAVASQATPLPSTWLMLLSGFVGLGFFAYRGTKKRAALAA